MNFRPTPLAHALTVALAWAVFLGIALGRPEPFLLAVPFIAALLHGAASRPHSAVQATVSVDRQQAAEGETLVRVIAAQIIAPAGPVQVLAVPPPLLRWRDPLPALVLPPPDGALVWHQHLTCAGSGVFELGRLGFRVWDRTGLWVGEQVVTQPAGVTVLPRALPVRHPPLPRRTGPLLGAHPSPVTGDGLAFAEVGRFLPGDRPRSINWPVSLRRQSLYANRFHPDRQADVVLLIDTFAVIGERPDSSLDHVLRAAAGLAAACLARHDRVGVVEYGGIVRSVRLSSGPLHARRLLAALARAAPIRTELLQDLRRLPEAVLPRRAMVVALTPLADARVARALAGLAERGQDVVALVLDTERLSLRLLRRAVRGAKPRA